MLTAVLFGWAPALHAMNSDVRGAMSCGHRRIDGARARPPHAVGAGGRRVRAGVADVRLRRAAGPRLRSRPQHRPGLRPIARADLHRVTPRRDLLRTTRSASHSGIGSQERLRALPGVEKAGIVSCAPVSGCHWGWLFFAEGAPPRAANDPNPIVLNRAGVAGLLPGDGHPAEGRPAASPTAMAATPSTKRARSSSTRPSSGRSGPTVVRDWQAGTQRREGTVAHRGRRGRTTSSTTASSGRRGRVSTCRCRRMSV